MIFAPGTRGTRRKHEGHTRDRMGEICEARESSLYVRVRLAAGAYPPTSYPRAANPRRQSYFPRPLTEARWLLTLCVT